MNSFNTLLFLSYLPTLLSFLYSISSSLLIASLRVWSFLQSISHRITEFSSFPFYSWSSSSLSASDFLHFNFWFDFFELLHPTMADSLLRSLVCPLSHFFYYLFMCFILIWNWDKCLKILPTEDLEVTKNEVLMEVTSTIIWCFEDEAAGYCQTWWTCKSTIIKHQSNVSFNCFWFFIIIVVWLLVSFSLYCLVRWYNKWCPQGIS